MKGILVFYVEAGQLPSEKSFELIERYKEGVNQDGALDELRKRYDLLFLPSRHSDTRVEVIAHPTENALGKPDFASEARRRGL